MLMRNMLQLRLLGGINERIIRGALLLATNPTPHPALHSSQPKDEFKEGSNPQRATRDEPFTPPKPPIASSPKLAHTEVGLPSKPNTHHKRPLSTQPAQPQSESITEINCSGLDGSEWPDDTMDQKAQNKAQEDDNKEYFKHHKASPLSEIEFADSRKPITQATDSNTSDEGLILFKEEQFDTAEESMLRATEIWKWNKIRGDPDSPHGRVLRELRGEFW